MMEFVLDSIDSEGSSDENRFELDLAADDRKSEKKLHCGSASSFPVENKNQMFVPLMIRPKMKQ